MRIFFIPAALVSMALSAVMAPGLAADLPATQSTVRVPVVHVETDLSKLTVRFPDPIGQRTLAVDEAPARAKLSQAKLEDVVEIEIDQIDNPQHVKKLINNSRVVSAWGRLWALVVGFAILLGLAALFTWGAPFKFVMGTDGRYSNSKCQLALWFGVVMMVYLAALILRVCLWGWDFLYGVEIPANLLALTGLSALTFGGAKVITTTKVENATKDAATKTGDAVKATQQADAAAANAAQATANGAPAAVISAHTAVAQAAANVATQAAAAANAVPKAPGVSNILTDLVQNDRGDPDIGDFQMIFITLLAAITFLLAGYNFLGAIAQSTHVFLPDVDTTLLSGFGLGQGAYLIKKMASKPGEG